MIKLYIKTSVTLLCMLFVFPAIAGSLFDEHSYKPLANDHRAHNVGDILTILIYEEASAKASAKSGISRQEDAGLSTNDGTTSLDRTIGVNNSFDGGGSLNRAGQLVARVSVVVNDVYDNGDLSISGEQKIEFNSETQNIIVKGRVRPQDIDNKNTVLSTRLANAEIKYMGEGLLSNREKPGIITRFFNWLF